MEMSLSFEQRVHWYRLATAGLLVIAGFAALSLLLPEAPVSASRLSTEARLGYLVFECLLSATVAASSMRFVRRRTHSRARSSPTCWGTSIPLRSRGAIAVASRRPAGHP